MLPEQRMPPLRPVLLLILAFVSACIAAYALSQSGGTHSLSTTKVNADGTTCKCQAQQTAGIAIACTAGFLVCYILLDNKEHRKQTQILIAQNPPTKHRVVRSDQ